MPLCDYLISVPSFQTKQRFLCTEHCIKPLYLQPFNKRFVQKSPFTMPGVYEVPDTLRQGSWAIKIDFKHGRISIFTEKPQADELLFSILSCSHACQPLKISLLCVEWQDIPIQSLVFWC